MMAKGGVMSELELSAEEQRKLAICEALVEEALQSVKAYKRHQQQAWATLRGVYRELGLEEYLLTRWHCEACGFRALARRLPLRKRCVDCRSWMSYGGLAVPNNMCMK
jgi:hypothetical protein